MAPQKGMHPDPGSRLGLAQLALLDALADAADLVWVARADDDRLLWVNEAFLACAGGQLEGVIGRTLSELGLELRSTAATAAIRNALDESPAASLTCELRTRAGETRFLEGSRKVVALDDQTFVVTIARDVTPREHVLDELRGSRGFVTEIVDAMPVGFVAVDEEFRISYANVLAGELALSSGANLLGRVLWDEFPHAMDPPFREAAIRAMEERVPTRVEQFYPPSDTWFDLSVVPIRSGLAIYFSEIGGRKRREEDIGRLAALVESAEDAIFGWTLDGVITSWNRAAERLYGFTAEEAVGRPPRLWLMPPGVPDDAMELVARVNAGEHVEGYETRRQHKDGTVLEVSLTVSPVYEASGRLIGGSTIARDMEPINRRIRDAAQLAAIVETSEDAIMSVTADGVLTSWNPAAERIFGFTSQEAIGSSPRALLISEGETDNSTELLRRVAQGELLIGVEVRRRRKDRSPVDISMTISPIRDSSGRFIGASAIARDITHEREVVRELQEAEARYRTLVEQVPVIIYDWGVSGDIDHVMGNYVSPQVEVILGFGAEEWVADPTLWFSRVHPDDLERVVEAGTRSIDEGVPFRQEYRMLAKDGHVVWLRDEALVLERDEEGRASFFKGVQLDITAQRVAEAAVRKSAEEKSQLIQLLAHELFTPITSIHGAAMTLSSLGERLSPTELKHLAEGVARGATRLRRLVQNVDAAAKLDRDDVRVPRRSVPVGQILTLALKDFQVESEAAGINVSADQRLLTRRTVADPSLAAQAVGVVVENALDYSNGEPIDIDLQESGEDLLIRVSDRGPGIPSAQRDLIFQLFTQVDSSDTRGHEGLGVGLFLARRVMRLHGGELDYETRPEGGSTFTFRFRSVPLPR
jgi:PAS domain S-box-containing protein